LAGGPFFVLYPNRALIDSHAHLTSDRLLPEIDAVLERAGAAGIERVVSVAIHADDAERAIELAGRHPRVHATAGIHPHDASLATADHLARVRDLLDRPEVVAVGETGLDFHYDNSPRNDQRRSFERHLDFAAETGLPVVVHARAADEEMEAVLRSRGAEVRGVLHCFSGPEALFEAAMEVGWMVSFTGIVTFRSFGGEDLVRRVPANRYMIETDAPYMAPVPHRGRRNEPAYVAEVAVRLAALRDEPVERVVADSTANAIRFFGLA
jgi:TatD DNase family protein